MDQAASQQLIQKLQSRDNMPTLLIIRQDSQATKEANLIYY
jgi:hypothetical protein